jgi:hypothetical protein
MRILIRTSKWAIWARRFGALAFPLGIIPVLLHRAHMIASGEFVVIEAVAIAIAGLAVLCALIAFGRLWVTGDQGWARAATGFVFGLICLLPAAIFGWLAVSMPGSPDISTDFSDPPMLVSYIEGRFITPEERQRLADAYPNARSRTYPLEAPQMFSLIETLVRQQGWELRVTRAPMSPLETGEINAVVTTLIGFQHGVAIRVRGDAAGSEIDMRSASLSPHPDFGENGQRVEAFLLQLDNQVTQLLRNAPVQPATAEDED